MASAIKFKKTTIVRKALLLCCHILLLTLSAGAQVEIDTLGLGWAKTSVNTVIFRKNSVSSWNGLQYASYYDSAGYVVLAVKRTSEKWRLVRTKLKGNVADAHNSISIIVDGDGILHMAWDHHNTPLKYCRSKAPGSLELTEPMSMIGKNEDRVTYPEFHRLPNGDLLFLHRDGESGRGNLIMNRYDARTKRWHRLQDNLIDGEGERNAYWQAFVSSKGTIHLSWVWREDPDVATNHDMCYARSRDGGVTWEQSNGKKYTLPIRAGNAEYAKLIPQQSELINQTSMTATEDDNPVIATYWREQGTTVPQFFVIWNDGKNWKYEQASQRKQPFTLKGGGTKNIPISRPVVIARGPVKNMELALYYRDDERRHMATIANRIQGHWLYKDIFPVTGSSWEPTCEIAPNVKKLTMLFQDVGQGDGEKVSDKKPTPVVIMTVTDPP